MLVASAIPTQCFQITRPDPGESPKSISQDFSSWENVHHMGPHSSVCKTSGPLGAKSVNFDFIDPTGLGGAFTSSKILVKVSLVNPIPNPSLLLWDTWVQELHLNRPTQAQSIHRANLLLCPFPSHTPGPREMKGREETLQGTHGIFQGAFR